jgi:uncharacterized protein
LKPWEVNVAELRRHTGEQRPFARDEVIEDASVGAMRVTEAPVQVSLVLEGVIGGVSVTGSAKASWVGECRRCLEPTAGEFEVAIDETFEERFTEGETYPIDGDVIDLEPMLRELLMLGLPLSPLCREDCVGPAPDQFPVTVEAESPPMDPRWAALDALRGEISP